MRLLEVYAGSRASLVLLEIKQMGGPGKFVPLVESLDGGCGI
jgi:hypothetical protein